jgi:type IV secretion system protein TrbI
MATHAMIRPDRKPDPEALELRARPRSVTRLNRRAIMIGAGAAALIVAGATILAFNPPHLFDRALGPEIYNTERKETAEGLAKLPKSYADIPKLGAPAPGDIGRLIVKEEQRLTPPAGEPQRSTAEEEAERAERIRQARIAVQARESGVFFRLSDKGTKKVAIRTETMRTGSSEVVEAAYQPGTGFKDALAAAAQREAAEREAERQTLLGEGRGGLARDDGMSPSQARKLAFVNARADTETVNPHALVTQPSPYTLLAGTLISASLITGLDSDLPGMVIAQVTENVFDTVTGEHLLVPQGARLIGKYDSVVAFGQKRALVIWNRLVLPNGTSIILENLPATDPAGYAGLEDEVDYHTWQLLKGIGLATVFGISSELTLGGNNQTNLITALRQSIQQSTNQAGQRIVERQLDVQPTITIRPGMPVRVIVSKDLVLKPYRDVEARTGK